jgi:putative ABC transport system permease protein
MKTIIRNFISVLRRYRLAAALNLLGLSVAFAAFMILMMQVNYDMTFDKCHKDADNIFRFEASYDKWQCVISRPLSNVFTASSPHIIAGALSSPGGGSDRLFFEVEIDGSKNFYEETACKVTPTFPDVFTFEMIEGDAKALSDPEKVLIPQSMAKKIFGQKSAVGQVFRGRNQAYTVGGVYRDFPRNTSIASVIYYPMPEGENSSSWGNWNYYYYIRVDNAANADGLIDNFFRTFDAKSMPDWAQKSFDDIKFRITPLAELHFSTDAMYDSTPKGSRRTNLILICIAFAVVVIACVNFTNFSAALVPKRIRSINTQKVLGGSTAVIRAALMLEAVVISILSFTISIGLMYIFRSLPLSSLVDAEISVGGYPWIITGSAVFAAVAGFLAGFYPAMYVTSFPPALVLKGSFGLSPKGRALRSVLIGIQFVASFALIIGASFMYLQNYYMQNSPTGYEKDFVIVTQVNRKVYEQHTAFENRLKSFAGIQDVTFAEVILSSRDRYMGWGRDYNGININFQCLPVSPTFLKVMGISVTDGRDFRPEDANMKYGTYIFNETAHKQFNLELGSRIDSSEIVGFMPDIKFASFRKEVDPMAFYVWGTENWGSTPSATYIRAEAGSSMFAAMKHVKETLAEFDPEYPFNVRFYDEVLQVTYESERKLSSLISIFSFVAILISIVGVFGLVIFDSEYRRKEISIRKTFGSTTGQIIILFNRTYIRILCVCFVLAAPLAYYAIAKWLENFAYKTPIHWWVFVTAFIAVAIITIITVTFQNWRAANLNPIESIKTE